MLSNAPVRLERALAALTVVSLWSAPGAAAGAEDPFSEPEARVVAAPRATEPARTPRSSDGYQHWLGGVFVGKGLRFNNPYRLRRVLGDDAESLSLTATYQDVHVGRTV
jgi:hypothetical protein